MNTPDIDIEALREWVRGMEDADIADGLSDFAGPPIQAARFLVSLADHKAALLVVGNDVVELQLNDGELWRIDPCPHGNEGECFHVLAWAWPDSTAPDAQNVLCKGGSRVRVWPKETE